MRRKFPSLAEPQKYGYIYDSDKFMDRRATIESRFRIFETGGDGLTQHSGDWSIISEQLTDYLWSFAAILPGDEELLQTAGHLFHSGVDVKTIEFASTIKYLENKTRHYNLRERQLKANPSIKVSEKEHWKQVPSWADGTAKAIYGLLTPEYADGFDRFTIACSLYEWCFADSEKRPWMTDPGRFLDWFKDYEPSQRLQSAYYTCQRTFEGYRLSKSANESLANHKEWLERQRKPAA